MKTLATCKPSEFLRQTNRIKRCAERWFSETGILKIRETKVSLESIPEDATVDERAEILERNKKLINDQAMENISKMMDSAFEEHPQETLELLALCCFVEPEDVDEYPMREYLEAFTSLMNDKAVIGFFTSLLMWVQTNTSNVSKV